MKKRFSKLCSLLLTFAVTATTVFSSDLSMVAAYADADVEAVPVVEEAVVDETEAAEEETTPVEEAVEAALAEEVVADDAAVEEVVADDEIIADDAATDEVVADEVTEEAEVDEVEGGFDEMQFVKNSEFFSAFKVDSVSADNAYYYFNISYTLKDGVAAPTTANFNLCNHSTKSILTPTFDEVVAGKSITTKGALLKTAKTSIPTTAFLKCHDVYAEVVFDIDAVYDPDDDEDLYELDYNTVSNNKGIIVTFRADDEDFDWYDENAKKVVAAKKIADTKGNYYYTGKAIKPQLVIYDGDARLTEGTDYTLKFKNNTKPYNKLDLSKAAVGTSYDVEDKDAPYVEIVGKGTYAKTLDQKKYFNIVPAEIKPCNLKDGNGDPWTDEIDEKDHDYYCAMVHADGTIKKDNIVLKSGKEAKVKTDVAIYSGITYKKDKKNNRKYKVTTTKLKAKGDNGDYFVKYISFNGLLDYCKDDDGDVYWDIDTLQEASAKAWFDAKAVDSVTEPNAYVALVSGNAAVGKLEAKAMAVDNFVVVDADHDLSKVKITVSDDSIVSYNAIKAGMRKYLEDGVLYDGDEFEVSPASITSMKVGKKELSAEEIAAFTFHITDADRKVGTKRRIDVDAGTEAMKLGYFGWAQGCKTKFEITADKDINDLKALLVVNVNGKEVIKEFDEKGNLDLTFGEVKDGDLDDYVANITLSNNTTGINYTNDDDDDSPLRKYGWDNKSKANSKYVGKYTINMEGIGQDGYAGKRKLTINVKPAEAKAEMVSNNDLNIAGFNDGKPVKRWEMSADKSSMTYARYYEMIDTKLVTGVPYSPAGYYEDYFNGYYDGYDLDDAYDASLYKINILNNYKATVDSKAYTVKIKMNAKKANAGDTVEGKFIYKGAITGEIPFKFDVKESNYNLQADDVALKVSENFTYSSKACASKIVGYKWDVTGYKVENGKLKAQYKKFILKQGKDYNVLDGRYKYGPRDSWGDPTSPKKWNSTTKKFEIDSNLAYKDGDPVVGEVVIANTEGIGNYKVDSSNKYSGLVKYRVGIDIKVFKKEITQMIKDGIVVANKYQGSEETAKAQIGQKYDNSFLTVMDDALTNAGYKLDNSKVGTIELKYGDSFEIDKDCLYTKAYNPKGKLGYRLEVSPVAGKYFVDVDGSGLLIGTLSVPITVDTRKDAAVTDYKYVLSK